jgi:hypothetical protein
MNLNSAAALGQLKLLGCKVKHICETEITGLVIGVEIDISCKAMYHVRWNKDDSTWHHASELVCV